MEGDGVVYPVLNCVDLVVAMLPWMAGITSSSKNREDTM